MRCTKFGWNWQSGSGEEVDNVNKLQTDRRTDGPTRTEIDRKESSSALKAQVSHPPPKNQKTKTKTKQTKTNKLTLPTCIRQGDFTTMIMQWKMFQEINFILLWARCFCSILFWARFFLLQQTVITNKAPKNTALDMANKEKTVTYVHFLNIKTFH